MSYENMNYVHSNSHESSAKWDSQRSNPSQYVVSPPSKNSQRNDNMETNQGSRPYLPPLPRGSPQLREGKSGKIFHASPTHHKTNAPVAPLPLNQITYKSPKSHSSRDPGDCTSVIPFVERHPRPLSSPSYLPMHPLNETLSQSFAVNTSSRNTLPKPTGPYNMLGDGFPVSVLTHYDQKSSEHGYFGGTYGTGLRYPSKEVFVRDSGEYKPFSLKAELEKRYRIYNPRKTQNGKSKSHNQTKRPSSNTPQPQPAARRKPLDPELMPTFARQIDEAWNRYMSNVEILAPPAVAAMSTPLDMEMTTDGDYEEWDENSLIEFNFDSTKQENEDDKGQGKDDKPEPVGAFMYHPRAPDDFQPMGRYRDEIDVPNRIGPKPVYPHLGEDDYLTGTTFNGISTQKESIGHNPFAQEPMAKHKNKKQQQNKRPSSSSTGNQHHNAIEYNETPQIGYSEPDNNGQLVESRSGVNASCGNNDNQIIESDLDKLNRQMEKMSEREAEKEKTRTEIEKQRKPKVVIKRFTEWIRN